MKLRLAVGPRDEQKLERTCQRLLSQIRFSRSLAESIEATNELSFVHDSIAVPYLVTAIEVKRTLAIDQRAITGLGRIGTSEATAALEHLQRDSRPETAKWASDVLRTLR